MMTLLEERLASDDSEFSRKIALQLEEKLADCRRRLMCGAGPQQYQQWQQEADAIRSAQFIFNKLKGEEFYDNS